jgi:hypothetical protein
MTTLDLLFGVVDRGRLLFWRFGGRELQLFGD